MRYFAIFIIISFGCQPQTKIEPSFDPTNTLLSEIRADRINNTTNEVVTEYVEKRLQKVEKEYSDRLEKSQIEVANCVKQAQTALSKIESCKEAGDNCKTGSQTIPQPIKNNRDMQSILTVSTKQSPSQAVSQSSVNITQQWDIWWMDFSKRHSSNCTVYFCKQTKSFYSNCHMALEEMFPKSKFSCAKIIYQNGMYQIQPYPLTIYGNNSTWGFVPYRVHGLVQ